MDVRHMFTVWAVVLWTAKYRHVYCVETRNIVCRFQGDFCGYTQDTRDDFDWTLVHEEVPEISELKQNGYICACRNSTALPPGSLARLVSPLYDVTTPSLLSLRFKYFTTDGDGSRLRISVEGTTRAVASRDKQPFFRLLAETKSALSWSTVEEKADVFEPFQLVIEAEVGFYTKSRLALDDLMLTLDAYPVSPQAGNPDSSNSSVTLTGGQLAPSDALTSRPDMTSESAHVPVFNNHTAHQERTQDSDGEGVSVCFILAVTSSSLLVILLFVFLFVVLSLSKRRRRYRRFTFGHNYEEIKGKESYNKTTSVSAMALTKERPRPRLAYHNRHTSFSRIQSLSACLSRASVRDSLHSSIYAEITEPDLDFDMELSDMGIGNSTTMTTTCTGTWDIQSSTDGSLSDATLAGESYVTASSFQKMYPSLSNGGSQNDSGWVENIIYERTSDISSLDSMGPFKRDPGPLKVFGRDKVTAGFRSRQRVHTV